MRFSFKNGPFSSFFTLLFACTVLISCQNRSTDNSDDVVFAKIKKVFSMQEEAWNSGNIDAFMTGYWNNEDMTFIGSRGVEYGWQTTLDNYKKNYPDREAMGTLSFEIKKLERLSDDVCYMIGKYTLQRTSDTPSGHFTLIWKKIDGKWVITSDHTS